MKTAYTDTISWNLRKMLLAFLVLTVLMILRGFQQVHSDQHAASLTGNGEVAHAMAVSQSASLYIQLRAQLKNALERAALDQNHELLQTRITRLSDQLNATAEIGPAGASTDVRPDKQTGAEFRKLVVESETLIAQVKQSLAQSLGVATSKPDEALEILENGEGTAAALSEHVADLLFANVTSINQVLNDHIEKMRAQTYGIDIPLALVAIGLLLWVSKVTKATTENYRLITQSLSRLGQGDTAISFTEGKHPEEIKDLLNSLIRFRDTLLQVQRHTEELNDTNARRAALSDSSLDGLITINDQGRLVDFNPAAERIFGFDRSKILDLPLADLIIPAQHREGHHRGMNHYLKSGEGPILRKRVEITALNAKGEEFPVELTVVPFKSQGSTYFLGAVRDISEKVQAEKEKDRINKLLQDSLNDRIAKQFAIDQHAIVSITSAKGAIRYVNDKFFQISGYSFDELAEQDHRILKSEVHPRGFFDSLWATIQGGNVWSGELCNRTKDGALYWVFSTIVPMIDSEGHIYEYVAISTDITQQKQVEASLVQAKLRAEAANEAKSQFLANMSHEIRTPLNATLGMLQLLRGTKLNEFQVNYLSKSESAAHFLQSLLNDVLDFSKIEANMLVIDSQAFWPQTTMSELEDVLRPQAVEKGITLSVRLPDLKSQVLGDENRLRQILLNLGSNAIKFTNEGEVEISAVVLATFERKVELQFCVRDTGIGIAPDQQEKIFETFTQAEASTTRRYGGSGLGLSICRGLLRLMGSAISLRSEPGVGSTFSFTLVLPTLDEPDSITSSASTIPRAADPLAQPLTPSTPVPAYVRAPIHGKPNDPATPDKPLQDMRILVVEDSVPNQEVAKGLLEQNGATVHVAPNGQLGLEAVLVASPPYDAVLMDIQMPVMDGFVATMAIRAISQFKDLPIIAMTANTISTDRDRCLSIGMNGYIGKPYEIADVVNILLTAIKKSKAKLTKAGSSPQNTLGLSTATLSCAAQGGLDLVQAIERMGGNKDIYFRALTSFEHELESVCHKLTTWQQEPRDEKASRLLHSFKGSSAILGFEALSNVFAEEEKSLSQSQASSLPPEDIKRLRKVIDPALQTTSALLVLLQQDIDRGKEKNPEPNEAEHDRVHFVNRLNQLMALLAAHNEAALGMLDKLGQEHPDQFMGMRQLLGQALEKRDFAQAKQICEDLLLAL